MAAAAPAAVAAPQVVARGEDDVRALAVKVFVLDEPRPVFQSFHVVLKMERGPGAALDAGRAEAVLVRSVTAAPRRQKRKPSVFVLEVRGLAG